MKNQQLCSTLLCKSEVEVQCISCKILTCISHSHSSQNHEVIHLFRQLNKFEQENGLNLITHLLIECNEAKAQITKNTKSIITSVIEETNLLMENIKSIERDLLKYIKTTAGVTKARASYFANEMEEKINIYIQNPSTLKNFDDLFKIDMNVLSKIIPEPTKTEPQSNPLECETPFMAFFDKASNVLKIFNVDSMAVKKSKQTPLWGNRSSWCPLPDGRIFYYGGWIGKTNTDLVALINPVTEELQLVKSGKKQRNLGQSCYYKGSVYVFAGYNEESNNKCYRYSLLPNSWTEIMSVPIASKDTNAAVLGDSIIVGGFHFDYLMEYVPNGGFYNKVKPVTADKNKAIWSGNGRAYALIDSTIIESKPYDLHSWSLLSNVVGVEDSRLMAHCVKYENNIYILYETKCLFKFSLIDKSFRQISNKVNV